MSALLDLASIALLWSFGFVVLDRFGTWWPITAAAAGLAGVFLVRSTHLRRLLRPTSQALGLGLVATAAMVGVTYVGYAAAVARFPSLTVATAGLYGLLGAKRTPSAALCALLLVTTLGEEVVFRGRLVAITDARAWPPLAGWLLTSALYAGFHLASGNLFLVAIAFLCGLYWGALRKLSGSLVPSMICHALWDLAILVVHPLI